jgi:hypothetical protein
MKPLLNLAAALGFFVAWATYVTAEFIGDTARVIERAANRGMNRMAKLAEDNQ